MAFCVHGVVPLPMGWKGRTDRCEGTGLQWNGVGLEVSWLGTRSVVQHQAIFPSGPQSKSKFLCSVLRTYFYSAVCFAWCKIQQLVFKKQHAGAAK